MLVQTTHFSKSVKRITKLGRTVRMSFRKPPAPDTWRRDGMVDRDHLFWEGMYVWLEFGDGTNVARRFVDAVNNALSVADPELESPFLRDFFGGRGLGNALPNPPRMESCTSEVLAVTALLYMGNPDIKTVHAAAWRDDDVTKFARCLHGTASTVVRSIKNSYTSAAQPHIPLIVRGCSIHSEVDSFIKMIQGDLLIWDTRHWSRPLSLCKWLLKIVQHDKSALDQLHQRAELGIRFW
ncbi:DNA helicase [Colletotrichum kahawae]|uniref:DNA helicase n=1 Tax=Colletotrichum kahawae TaxID=34407 RepID=A0AAD9Y2T5_COLKA|nr:DNA helicase [Colletotrichum kahawae]